MHGRLHQKVLRMLVHGVPFVQETVGNEIYRTIRIITQTVYYILLFDPKKQIISNAVKCSSRLANRGEVYV